ncbi:MAG: hypothetical protein WD035_07550 [Balneolaceae bacterium]
MDQPIKLYDLIVRSCEAGLRLQNTQKGFMPAGHNGPYQDPETPVRNTSHWTILFLKAYDISKENRFLEAARKALDYLGGQEARPMGKTFHHRTHPAKDTCNGLIGQAWTCEALVYAGEFLDEKKYIDLAGEVFLLHPFDRECGAWQRVAVDGMTLPYDRTFNHQLWFGAIGSQLSEHNEDVREQVIRFTDLLPVHLQVYRSGLIYHPLILRFSLKQKAEELKRLIRQGAGNRKALAHKAIGYHLFNLYGFSLIYKQMPELAIWKDRNFRKALRYAASGEFRHLLPSNPYGYAYNPPGIEMACVMDTFGTGDQKQQAEWVEKQLKHSWNDESNFMERNTKDPLTLSARLYEAVRLPNLEII